MKIPINVKIEFEKPQKSEIRHFSHILSHGLKSRKYASFEGVEISLTS